MHKCSCHKVWIQFMRISQSAVRYTTNIPLVHSGTCMQCHLQMLNATKPRSDQVTPWSQVQSEARHLTTCRIMYTEFNNQPQCHKQGRMVVPTCSDWHSSCEPQCMLLLVQPLLQGFVLATVLGLAQPLGFNACGYVGPVFAAG